MGVYSEKVQTIVDAYGKEGLYKEAIVNELLRFQAVDQLLSSSASVNQWGISLEELYALTKSATEGTFGDLSIREDAFGYLYRLSFSVDVFSFAEEIKCYEDIKSGKEWQSVLDPLLLDCSQSIEKRVLFGFVEEYMSLLGPILQGLGKDNVVLHTKSEECYEVLSKLYPLATIKKEWPYEEFTHIIAITRAEDAKGVLSVVNRGESLLLEGGKMDLFLSPAVSMAKSLDKSQSLKPLLESHKLLFVEERLPLSVYHWHFEDHTENVVQLRYKEEGRASVLLDSIDKNKLAKLSVLSLLPYYKSMEEGSENGKISLCNQVEKKIPLYEDSMILKANQTEVLHDYDLVVEPYQVGYRVVPLYRKRKRLVFGDDCAIIAFSEEISAYPWLLYFEREEGERVVRHLSSYVQSALSLAQLMRALVRSDIGKEQLRALGNAYKKAHYAYEKQVESAEKKWIKEQEKLFSEFVR